MFAWLFEINFQSFFLCWLKSQKVKGTKLGRRLDETFLSRHIEVKLLAVLPRCYGSRLPSGRRHISRTSQPCGQLQNCAAFMQLMAKTIKRKNETIVCDMTSSDKSSDKKIKKNSPAASMLSQIAILPLTYFLSLLLVGFEGQLSNPGLNLCTP